MTAKNESPLQTPFTVTIEAREGVTTGISAHDRARTIQVAVDPLSGPDGPRPARPRQPAEGEARRRARAHRPHRGERRPGAARRALPGRRDLRGHERRRIDGARARPRRLLRAPRAEDDHDQGPDRVPPPLGQARRARRLDAAADRVRRLRGGRLPLARRRQAPPRARQGRHRGHAPTCSCASTPSASPATSSTRERCDCGEQLDVGAGDDRAGGRAACCSTSPRRAAASACSTSCAPTSSRRRASTRSRPTSGSACPPTCATTASAPRSSSTSGSQLDPHPHQQPEEDPRARGLRPLGHRPDPDRAAAEPGERRLPADQARQARPHAPPPGPRPRRRDAARRARVRAPARAPDGDRYAIVVARFYEDLAERARGRRPRRSSRRSGATVEVFDVPGAFELPAAAQYAARERALRRASPASAR